MRSRSTSTLANWLLNFFCSGKEYDSVIGDLAEQISQGRGGLWVWRQVLSITLLGLRRRVSHRPLIPQRNFPVGLALRCLRLLCTTSRCCAHWRSRDSVEDCCSE